MAVVRVALAALLAAALVAAATPAVQDARRGAAQDAAGVEISALRRAGVDLLDAASPVRPNRSGARRTLALTLPERGPGSAGVRALVVGSAPGSGRRDGPRGDLVTVRVRGAAPTTRRLPFDVRVGSATAPENHSLVLRDDAHLALRYVRGPDGPVVVVARCRGFTCGNATTAAHAGHRRPGARAVRGPGGL